jgi:hypothetical protein
MKKLFYCFLAFVLLLVSCGKQDTVYKQFFVEGGYIYPAKALNLSAVSGYQRVILTWEVPMDPSLRSAKLFWDNRRDSLSFDYSLYPSGVVKTAIENLEDRSYTFEVINYDSAGNSSLAVEITTSPFADNWLVSHAERAVESARLVGNDAVVIMRDPTDETVMTKFRYLTKDGQTVESGVLKADEYEIHLPNADGSRYFEYQSAYTPTEGIDTVWTGNWVKSTKPITQSFDASIATVTVTANQIRDNFYPSLIIDGIKDSSSSRWYSSNASEYKKIFPKILVIDTKLSGDDAITFTDFIFYEDPDPEGSTRRFIKAISIYVTDKKPNPDDANWQKTYGEPVLLASLTQDDAVQSFKPFEKTAGRYIAIVFRNSHRSTDGFIDLWEFEAYGYVEKKLN